MHVFGVWGWPGGWPPICFFFFSTYIRKRTWINRCIYTENSQIIHMAQRSSTQAEQRERRERERERRTTGTAHSKAALIIKLREQRERERGEVHKGAGNRGRRREGRSVSKAVPSIKGNEKEREGGRGSPGARREGRTTDGHCFFLSCVFVRDRSIHSRSCHRSSMGPCIVAPRCSRTRDTAHSEEERTMDKVIDMHTHIY